MLKAAIGLFAGLALAIPVSAHSAAVRISGAVETLIGDTLVVKSDDRQDITIALSKDTRIAALANRQLSDIKPGDFVGSVAIKGRDGKLHAQEVHIFPEAMRGTGEGHRHMAKPDQTMTNATVTAVTGVAEAPTAHVLTLSYKGGVQEIEVGPDARIVTFISGDRSLLKPGAMVVVSVTKGPDGSWIARGMQAEKDGVLPLMF
jgi:hypothetical protein